MHKLLVSAAIAAGLSTSAPAVVTPKVDVAASAKTSASVQAQASKNSLDRACMATAVDTRESSLGASMELYLGTMVKLHNTRRADLKAAWATEDRQTRIEMIRKAWTTFEKSRHDARKTFHDAQKKAWKTFLSDAKKCGATHADLKADGSIDATLDL